MQQVVGQLARPRVGPLEVLEDERDGHRRRERLDPRAAGAAHVLGVALGSVRASSPRPESSDSRCGRESLGAVAEERLQLDPESGAHCERRGVLLEPEPGPATPRPRAAGGTRRRRRHSCPRARSTESPPRSRSSLSMRVFPMPASPSTRSTWPRPARRSSRATAQPLRALRRGRRAASARRPRALCIGRRRRQTDTGSSRPFTETSPSGSNTNRSTRRRAVASPTTTEPGSATPWRRAATFAVSPSATDWRFAPPTRPTATGPLFRPTRTLKSEIPQAASMSRAYSPTTWTMCSAARAARSGIVLVGHGDAEEGGDPVAHEGVDDAAELLDGSRHAADALADQRLHLLGSQPLADRGRADDVGEQRRDGPKLVRVLQRIRLGGAASSGTHDATWVACHRPVELRLPTCSGSGDAISTAIDGAADLDAVSRPSGVTEPMIASRSRACRCASRDPRPRAHRRRA